MLRLGLFIAALGASSLFFSSSAHAATITVSSGAVDQTVNGNCSIYEAIEAANTDTTVDACPAGSGADTINLPDGVYNLQSPDNLVVTSDVYIVGQSRASTIIDGGGASVGIELSSGTVDFSLEHLTIRNSQKGLYAFQLDASIAINDTIWTGGNGGYQINVSANSDGTPFGSFSFTNSELANNLVGINNENLLSAQEYQTVLVDNIQAHDNQRLDPSQNDNGGVLFVDGASATLSKIDLYDNTLGSTMVADTKATNSSLALSQVDIYNNHTAFGAILLANNVTIQDSSFTGQQPVYMHGDTVSYIVLQIGVEGGHGPLNLDMNNVTIAENDTLYPSLSILMDNGQLVGGTISNVTIANNRPAMDIGMSIPTGIGLLFNPDVNGLVLRNIILDNNTDFGGNPANCDVNLFEQSSAAVTSGGGNLSSDSTCSFMFNHASDLANTSPLLGPLTDVNNTWVMPLLAGSPAVDTGVTISGLGADQRGVARPQGLAYDRGAYELISASILPSGGGNSSGGNTQNGTSTQQGQQLKGAGSLVDTGDNITQIVFIAALLIGGALCSMITRRFKLSVRL